MRIPPVPCGCSALAGMLAFTGELGRDGMLSNLGSGAAVDMHRSAHFHFGPLEGRLTLEAQLWSRVSAGLIMSDESQSDAEAGLGQETAVLDVCQLPDL